MPSSSRAFLVLKSRLLVWLYGKWAVTWAFVRDNLVRYPFSFLLPLGPRPGARNVSRKWMQKVLSQNGLLPPNVEVASCRAAALEENRGLASVTGKVVVTYNERRRRRRRNELVVDGGSSSSRSLEEDDGTKGFLVPRPAPPPESFILKMSAGTAEHRATVLFSQRYRECWFYTDPWLTAPLKGSIPILYYAHTSRLAGEYVMLLSDNNPSTSNDSATIPVNFLMGNQIWGLPQNFKVPPACTDLKIMAKMYQYLAWQHAKFWRSPQLLVEEGGRGVNRTTTGGGTRSQRRWLRGAEWYANKGRSTWELSMEVTRTYWAMAKVKFGKRTSHDLYRLSQRMVDLMDSALANSTWEGLQAHIHSTPFTLCHADFHAANLFYHSGTEDFTVFDWSEVGPWEPCLDVAQTVISDLDRKHFGEETVKLVHLYYWCELCSNGVKDYPWNQCLADYKRVGVEKWLWVFAVMAGWRDIPPALISYFEQQILAFIDAHYVDEPLPPFSMKIIGILANVCY